MSTGYIVRPNVPTVHELRLREDGYITHEIAELQLPKAVGMLRRHVDPDGDVMSSGHIDADTQLSLDEADQLAAKQRHPAGHAR